MEVNYRQVSIFVFMSFIAVKLLRLPSWLYADSGSASWFVALVLMIIDGIFAFLIIDLMKKNKDKNIYEFMKNTLGVPLTKVFLAVLALKYVIVLAIIGKGLEFYIVENLYEKYNWFLYGTPLIIVATFMVYKGIKNIARVQEFFWIMIAVGCLYIAVKELAEVDYWVYVPFLKEGAKAIATSSFNHLCWFGSSTFLFMLFGKVDFSQGKKSQLATKILFAILLVQIIYFVFYGLFDNTSPMHQFCLSDISQYTKENVMSELSWLIVCLWIVAQLVQFALYGYCFTEAIMYLFDIKHKIVGVVILDLYILFWGIYGTNAISPENLFLSKYVNIMTIVAEYAITLVLWVGYGVRQLKNKKVAKYENNKNII